ncbi:hypothetical protein CC79DRAFT_1334169 [Sarocladium strictum]
MWRTEDRGQLRVFTRIPLARSASQSPRAASASFDRPYDNGSRDFRFLRTSLSITDAPALQRLIGGTGLRHAARLMTGRAGVILATGSLSVPLKLWQLEKWKNGKMERWTDREKSKRNN